MNVLHLLDRYVSYFFHFRDDPQLGTGALAALRNPMIERAAVLTSAALEVREQIQSKTARPPQGKPGDFKCAVGYNMAFNSCRIPTPRCDVGYIYDCADGANSHIVVIRRGQFFRLETTTAPRRSHAESETKTSDRRRLTTAEIAHQLQHIVMLSDLDASSGCV